MAYNEETARRIRMVLNRKGADFAEKPMFGGLCFMVNDKMCCGTRIDKKTGEELMLCRIGEEAATRALENDDCLPMQFTGRTMKDFVYVTEAGIRQDRSLDQWLQRCLDYNPVARASKK